MERDWNRKEPETPEEGLQSSPIPKMVLGHETALWSAKNLSGEHRRILMKFLVGKFPIPTKGTRIPRGLIRELATLVKKDPKWTQVEERRVVENVSSLKRLTQVTTPP